MCILLQQMDLVLNGVESGNTKQADIALSLMALIVAQGCDHCDIGCVNSEPIPVEASFSQPLVEPSKAA